MITEDYVSFETAKLLKEKGFDCTCKAWYAEYTSQFGGEKYSTIEFDSHNKFNENYKFICHAPTLQMAMKWLREVHHIVIITNYANICGLGFTYVASIIKINDNREIEEGPDSNTCVYGASYEESCEAAIKYCLENLI